MRTVSAHPLRWQGVARIAVCVGLLPTAAWAVDKGKAKYCGGTLAGVTSGTEGPIDLRDGDKLVFMPGESRIEIPWVAVQDVEYSAKRMGAVLRALDPLLAKVKRHYVTLSFKDAQEVRQLAVFEVDKSDVRLVLSLIRLRTGRAISCEGEDVTDPIEACSGDAPRPAMAVATVKGPRVRVLAPALAGTPIEGELVASDETTITIRRTHVDRLADERTYGKNLRLPRELVTRYERSVRPSRKRLGGTIGGGIGFVVGVVVVETTKEPGTRGQSGLVAALIGLPFAFLGAAVAPGEQWAAEDPMKVRAAIARGTHGGLGLSLSVRF